MSCVLICSICGNGYVGTRKVANGVCRSRECHNAAELKRTHKSRDIAKRIPAPVERAIARGVTKLTVVNDPLEDGGFKAGTSFPKDYWELMLKDMTFTPGTILIDGQNRLYEFQLKKDYSIPEKLEA